MIAFSVLALIAITVFIRSYTNQKNCPSGQEWSEQCKECYLACNEGLVWDYRKCMCVAKPTSCSGADGSLVDPSTGSLYTAKGDTQILTDDGNGCTTAYTEQAPKTYQDKLGKVCKLAYCTASALNPQCTSTSKFDGLSMDPLRCAMDCKSNTVVSSYYPLFSDNKDFQACLYKKPDPTNPLKCDELTEDDLSRICNYDVNGCPSGYTLDKVTNKCKNIKEATLDPSTKKGCRPIGKDFRWQGGACIDDTIIFDIDTVVDPSSDVLGVRGTFSMGGDTATQPQYRLHAMIMEMDSEGNNVFDTSTPVMLTYSKMASSANANKLAYSFVGELEQAQKLRPAKYRLVMYMFLADGNTLIIKHMNTNADPSKTTNNLNVMGTPFTPKDDNYDTPSRRAFAPVPLRTAANEVATTKGLSQVIGDGHVLNPGSFVPYPTYGKTCKTTADCASGNTSSVLECLGGVCTLPLPFYKDSTLPYAICICDSKVCKSATNLQDNQMMTIVALNVPMWPTKATVPSSTGTMCYYAKRTLYGGNSPVETVIFDTGNTSLKTMLILFKYSTGDSMYFVDTNIIGSQTLYEIGYYVVPKGTSSSYQQAYASNPENASSLTNIVVQTPYYDNSLCLNNTYDQTSTMVPPFKVYNRDTGYCDVAGTTKQEVGIKDVYCMFGHDSKTGKPKSLADAKSSFALGFSQTNLPIQLYNIVGSADTCSVVQPITDPKLSLV